jgi:enterochelin esterase family protein
MQVGRFETQPAAAGPSLLTANRHLRDVLQAQGHDVRYAEFSGGHAHPSWRAGFAQALLALFAP